MQPNFTFELQKLFLDLELETRTPSNLEVLVEFLVWSSSCWTYFFLNYNEPDDDYDKNAFN